ncbi:MAG: GFA family protein, partial [Hyphomicrobiales bacterium]|nr:GFA family protein [Hyphomicrobiales bacterium]
MPQPYMLSCHCGAIRLEVDAELAGLHECNCSTCARSGFLHWKVPVAAVRLVTQKRQLATYLWRDAGGGHQFCPTCGTAMLRTGYGDRISVNARCLEGVDIFELEASRYDGRKLMPPG